MVAMAPTGDSQDNSSSLRPGPRSGVFPSTVAIVANADEPLYRFRTPLIRALVERGAVVYLIAPPGPYVAELESTGATFVPWQLSRSSLDPRRELRALIGLWRIYRRLSPTVVQHFTTKPNIYGAIAGWLARVPVVVAGVTGLGYVFTSREASRRLMRAMIAPLYRLMSLLSDAVTFQNPDDIELLVDIRAVSRAKSKLILGGSGVDVDFYRPGALNEEAKSSLLCSLGVPGDALIVTLVARMLWDKGIGEYVDCARVIKLRNRYVEFLLVGPTDQGNRSAIPLRTLTDWDRAGVVRYLGHRQDVRDLLAISDIVALPSYREGLPRVLLEAAAMGNAIVTADTPGCRDVVEHEATGLLVPARDSAALVEAVERLLLSPSLRRRIGLAARELATERFDQRRVVSRILELYEALMLEKRRGSVGG